MNAMEEVVLDLDVERVEVGRAVIWKAKDTDYSVTIAGDLGMGSDGRRYVSVASTCTGIPLDELEL